MTGPHALFVFPHDIMGGAERVTRLLAQAALQSGRFGDVTLLVMSGADSGTLHDLGNMPGARLRHSGARGLWLALPDLLRVCWRTRFSFVFSSFTFPNAILSFMRTARLLRTDRLVTRESTMAFERDFGRKSRPARLLYKLYGSQDQIVCQTDRMALSLTANVPDRLAQRVIVIPNPVAPVLPDQGPMERLKGMIVWCGRLATVKAPIRAVDTIAQLCAGDMPDVHLVMIGDGPLRSKVEERIAVLGLQGKVTLTGHLDRPIDVMLRASAGLITSDIEGFPNVILEMLAAGVPAIATTDCAGGIVDVPGAVVAQTTTPESLSRAVATALSVPGQSDNARQFIQARQPDIILKQLLQISSD